MIPKTMKAAVVREYGAKLQIEEVEVKRPGRHQALVKVIACGVCHTDLHAIEGDWPVKATVTSAKLENINEVLDQMRANKIDGRIVLDIANS